jgi:hypothetical protein
LRLVVEARVQRHKDRQGFLAASIPYSLSWEHASKLEMILVIYLVLKALTLEAVAGNDIAKL